LKPGLNQSTQLRQELKINPRLYQAMDLLYMPLLDLQQHLKQELLNNPFLDLVEAEDEEEEQEGEAEEPAQAEAEDERVGEIDWEEILLDGFDTAGGRREEHEEREYFEPVTVATRDLSDHLRDQVSLLELTPRQTLLADEFIGNVNDDGYLACGVEDIVRALNDVVTKAAEEAGRDTEELPLYSLDEGQDMLGTIQNLDSARRRRPESSRMSPSPAKGGWSRAVCAVPPRS